MNGGKAETKEDCLLLSVGCRGVGGGLGFH